MAIKVIIERKSVPGNELALNQLLMELRSGAMHAPGYISGETLRSLDDANSIIVISTWDSLETWKKWAESPERKEVQAKIDALLRAPATHKVYIYF